MLNNIKLIGTSHISRESIKEIKESIDSFKPDLIAVELDQKRFYALKNNIKSKVRFSDIKRIGVIGFLFLIIGQKFQQKLGSMVGMNPGEEMLFAANIAKTNKLALSLIDQDIELTLRNFSKSFTFKEKMRLLKDLIFGFLSKEKIKLDISKVPEDKLIEKLLTELKNKYPNLYSSLVEDRNKYMAKKLFHLLRQNPKKKILVVIGAAHLKGLTNELKMFYYSNISLK